MDGFGPSLRFALRAVTDIMGTILVPAFVAAMLGKYFDVRYGTGHTIFIVLLAFTFLGTSVLLVKKVGQYAKEYKKLISR